MLPGSVSRPLACTSRQHRSGHPVPRRMVHLASGRNIIEARCSSSSKHRQFNCFPSPSLICWNLVQCGLVVLNSGKFTKRFITVERALPITFQNCVKRFNLVGGRNGSFPASGGSWRSQSEAGALCKSKQVGPTGAARL